MLWYFRVSNKNGVQLRSIGTCSRISGYQRARDEAKVDTDTLREYIGITSKTQNRGMEPTI